MNSPADEISTGEETILLVDDEEIIAETTQEMLEMLGYRTLLAGSGQEAIDVFTRQGKIIDLVILDMVMPHMNGTKVFETLRTIDSTVKIILSSGHPLNDEIQSLLDQGCSGFIQKPFRIENLSVIIRQVIEKSENK